MSWFGLDGDEGERMKNFMLYKLWMTDKEKEEAAPFFLAILGIIVVIIGLSYLF